MNLLLDTHVALWAITDSPRLNAQAREWIESPRATVWVSAATVWEIAIKHGLGRGDMPVSGQEALDYFRASGYRLLEHAYAEILQKLPPELVAIVPIWDQMYMERFHSEFVVRIPLPTWDAMLCLEEVQP